MPTKLEIEEQIDALELVLDAGLSKRIEPSIIAILAEKRATLAKMDDATHETVRVLVYRYEGGSVGACEMSAARRDETDVAIISARIPRPQPLEIDGDVEVIGGGT